MNHIKTLAQLVIARCLNPSPPCESGLPRALFGYRVPRIDGRGRCAIVIGQSNGTAAATRELKRIALLSAPSEVQAAEAERERKQRKIKNTGYLVVFALIGALIVPAWIGSTFNKVTTNAVVAATAYVTPTPYNQPDITPTPQAEIEKDARQQEERDQQWADHESNQKVTSTPTPNPARPQNGMARILTSTCCK